MKAFVTDQTRSWFDKLFTNIAVYYLISFPFVLLLSQGSALADELKLIPSITLKDQYNDNLFFDTTDASNKVRDNISIVSPGIRFSDRTEIMDASLQSRCDSIRYRDNKDFNTTDQEHLGRCRYILTERTVVSADASYAKDSMNDRDISTTGLVMGTEQRVKKHGGIGAEYAMTEITRTSLSYAYYAEEFDNPAYVDSTVHNINLGFSRNMHAILSNTQAKMNFGYSFYRYQGLDEDNSSATIGLEKRINEKLNFNMHLGMRQSVMHFDESTSDENNTRTNGAQGQLQMVYNGEVVSGSCMLSQEISVASGKLRTMQVRSARVSAGKRFTSDLQASLNAGYFQNKTNTSHITSGDIDRDNWQIEPSLRYKITNDIALDSSYRFVHTQDYITHKTSRQSVVYLRIVWEYPCRI